MGRPIPNLAPPRSWIQRRGDAAQARAEGRQRPKGVARFNHIQGILPRAVQVADFDLDPAEKSLITPAGIMLQFWFVRTWALTIEANFSVSGSDGYHNTANGTVAIPLLAGPGAFQDVPPTSEHDLLKLITPFYGYGFITGVETSFSFEDGMSASHENTFYLEIGAFYKWNDNYNPARESNASDYELDLRSFCRATIANVPGVGNGVGDTFSGADGMQNSITKPLIWTPGDDRSTFSASIEETEPSSGSFGGIAYTRSAELLLTLTPVEWWPWDDDDGPLYDTGTGELL